MVLVVVVVVVVVVVLVVVVVVVIGGWSGNNCYDIDSKQITTLPEAKNR